MDSTNSHKKIQITLSHINGSRAIFALKCAGVLIKCYDKLECTLAWGYLFSYCMHFMIKNIL